MMRYVAPIEQTLRHVSLPKPKVPAIPRRQRPTAVTKHGETDPSRSQILAEHAAAAIGSWRFLIIQACVLVAWVVVNALRFLGIDPPPFILLNLLLSFQAAFTGPILLIAANVGALRDHKQYDRIEQIAAHTEQTAAHTERLVERMEAMEARLAARERAASRPRKQRGDA